MVLERPSGILDNGKINTANADGYGSKFILEGQVGDDNNVSLIELKCSYDGTKFNYNDTEGNRIWLIKPTKDYKLTSNGKDIFAVSDSEKNARNLIEKLGKYSVSQGEVVTLEGFNLGGAVSQASINGSSVTSTRNGLSSIDIPIGTNTTSGRLEIAVDASDSYLVYALNNKNSNPVFGSDGQTVTKQVILQILVLRERATILQQLILLHQDII